MLVSFRSSAALLIVPTQLKKFMRDESESGDLIPIGTPVVLSHTYNSRSSTTGRAGKNKIVPTVSEDPVVPFEIERTGGESSANPGSLPC